MNQLIISVIIEHIKIFLDWSKLQYVSVPRREVNSEGVWIPTASTYKWTRPRAESASRPSSSSTSPLPNLSTFTPICPCALEGTVILLTTGHQTRPPTCPRGLGGHGRLFTCVQIVLMSKKHRDQCSLRDLGEIAYTWAFLGHWLIHSH